MLKEGQNSAKNEQFRALSHTLISNKNKFKKKTKFLIYRDITHTPQDKKLLFILDPTKNHTFPKIINRLNFWCNF